MTKLGLLSFLSASAVTLAFAVKPTPRVEAGASTVTAAKPVKPLPVVAPIAHVGATAASPQTPTIGAVNASVFVRAPWGAGAGELGHEVPSEAMPEAPMSLAVDASGSAWVLDQVNQRIAIFGPTGAFSRSIPIANRLAQDLTLLPGGELAILDRIVDKAIVFLDPSGKEKTRVAVVGAGVAEATAVTAMFSYGNPADPLAGTWVEVGHETLVRVALVDGLPDPARIRLDGRRVGSGPRLLRAARDPAGFAVVSALGAGGFLVRVATGQPVLQLEGLFGDAKGRTWVAAHTYQEGPTNALVDERLTIVAFAQDGSEIGRVDLPPPEAPGDQFAPTALGADGAFYHLHVGKTAATIWRIR